MGTDSILKAQDHILALITKADTPQMSEDIHSLCHALEILMQVEHMNIAIKGSATTNSEFEFPSDFE